MKEPIKERTALEEIELLIKARYPLIYIISFEEKRVLEAIKKIASNTIKVFKWTLSKGITDFEEKAVGEGTTDPDLALDYVLTSRHNGIFIFQDFHPFISSIREIAPRCIRKLRDIANSLPSSPYTKSLIILSPILEIPPELEKDIVVVDFPLPTLAELDEMLSGIERSMRNRPEFKIDLTPQEREEILKAALGLTLTEAENAFAKALIEDLTLDKSDISRILKEKEQIIKKSGMLEYITPDESIAAVGGLEALKEWFRERAHGFSERAREFPLPTPRGVLLIGVPGCGKSLCAKVVAYEWKKPLLRFDVGRAFGKYVGESEANMRRAIKTAESLAPCILWIDEIEKEFGGVSGEGDSGTSARVFASFLTWMQEKKSPVFVLATANNIHRLPPEFLRKGRFDEIFFVDLPFDDEREEIFKIHLTKRKRDPRNFDIERLVRESEGYSGAEIEEAIVSALYRVFNLNRDLTTEDILLVLKETRPLSVVMEEEIKRMRTWAKDRARYASLKGRTETGEVVDRWAKIGAPK
jgi:SpoVK/Ycf46/Vps4 family AAA+-type ATPase